MAQRLTHLDVAHSPNLSELAICLLLFGRPTMTRTTSALRTLRLRGCASVTDSLMLSYWPCALHLLTLDVNGCIKLTDSSFKMLAAAFDRPPARRCVCTAGACCEACQP